MKTTIKWIDIRDMTPEHGERYLFSIKEGKVISDKLVSFGVWDNHYAEAYLDYQDEVVNIDSIDAWAYEPEVYKEENRNE